MVPAKIGNRSLENTSVEFGAGSVQIRDGKKVLKMLEEAGAIEIVIEKFVAYLKAWDPQILAMTVKEAKAAGISKEELAAKQKVALVMARNVKDAGAGLIKLFEVSQEQIFRDARFGIKKGDTPEEALSRLGFTDKQILTLAAMMKQMKEDAPAAAAELVAPTEPEMIEVEAQVG